MGSNCETQQRLADMLQMSRDVLDGKLAGEKNPQGMLGLNNVLSMHGVRINYADSALKSAPFLSVNTDDISPIPPIPPRFC